MQQCEIKDNKGESALLSSQGRAEIVTRHPGVLTEENLPEVEKFEENTERQGLMGLTAQFTQLGSAEALTEASADHGNE